MAQQAIDGDTMDGNGNPRLVHPDVRAAYREDCASIEAMLDALQDQEMRDGQREEFRCDGGKHRFRVYLTDLPRVHAEDLEPGLLLYDPTGLSHGVWEVTDNPFMKRRSYYCPTIRHFRQPDGEIGNLRMERQFVARLTDDFTVLQPETVQSTIGE